jgi:integrase/recombinase XerD
MTPHELVLRSLLARAPAWSEDTLAHHRASLRRFLGFLAGRSLRRDDVLAYVRHVRARRTPKGEPWSQHMVAGVLRDLRAFLGWAEKEGHILESLAAWIEVRTVQSLPRALSEEDAACLIDDGPKPGPWQARDRAILELLYGTGVRASEACRLDLTDVALLEGLLLVREGKGRKDRVVPFGERVRAALLAYLREERRPQRMSRFAKRTSQPSYGPLFPSRRGGRLTRDGLSQILGRAKKRAGLAVPASAHCLRHSYATHLLRRGADVVSLKALLGHARLASTEVYLDLDVSDLKRMIEKSHPREKGVTIPDQL